MGQWKKYYAVALGLWVLESTLIWVPECYYFSFFQQTKIISTNIETFQENYYIASLVLWVLVLTQLFFYLSYLILLRLWVPECRYFVSNRQSIEQG